MTNHTHETIIFNVNIWKISEKQQLEIHLQSVKIIKILKLWVNLGIYLYVICYLFYFFIIFLVYR